MTTQRPVNGAVTPHGVVSFALRWHGARPALLWDVSDGVALGAPGLDPAWEGGPGPGEALLSEMDPNRLLPLRTTSGTDSGSEAGVIVDDPGSFL